MSSGSSGTIYLTFAQAIAQAIVDQLAVGTWDVEFTPNRRYAASWLKVNDGDAENVHVDVCQGEEVTNIISRSSKNHVCEVTVAIRKKFGTSERDGTDIDLVALDSLSKLQSDIVDWFNSDVANWNIDVSADTGIINAIARLSPTPIKSTYLPSHLIQMHQYTGVITVEFQGVLNC